MAPSRLGLFGTFAAQVGMIAASTLIPDAANDAANVNDSSSFVGSMSSEVITVCARLDYLSLIPFGRFS